MKLQLRLGEVNICISVIHEALYARFREFLTSKKAQYFLSLSDERLNEEKKILLEEYPHIQFPEHEIEYNALYRDIPQLLFSENIIIFHGVLLVMNGEGYLFTADSGVGKTTHALLWKKIFADNVKIINGDKPLLKIKNDSLYGYGSPWKGKENIGFNDCVKIKAICKIHRSENNHIAKTENKNEVIPWLLNQTMLKNREQHWKEIISWYMRIFSFVEFYDLFCNTNDDSALIAYHGMSPKNP